MINLSEITHQMTVNAEAIRALVLAFPHEQTLWKPDPQAWAMKNVMEHVYNEERMDFCRHLKEMFGAPPQPPEFIPVSDCHQALDDFLWEREDSIAWLKALQSPDWQVTKRLQFAPDDSLTISAAEMLLSWVEHDYLHMRQMVELLHAWNVNRASLDAVRYAGGW